ncbi:branched-chain-amino-acid transaminase [Acuticoccus sediminis]|uniref:branched-chain-amino-acid transaminase n=1 Tax=Acuticoccus sediminis TaxID=2184697 RepID=UPI001CFDAF42|nr:branched-chain-amino-acid transaminase [Acuticoccus sediminis]
MPTAPYMYLDGSIVPYADAKVHAFSGVVKYGCGVFEGLRAYRSASGNLLLFRLAEHIDRLRFGMKAMRYERILPHDEIEEAVVSMLRANDLREDTHVRVIAYLGGDDPLHQTGPVGLIAGALPRPSRGVGGGLHATVSSWRRIADSALPPRVKCTGNYVNNRTAEIEAVQDGYDAVLMMTADGKLAEGSGACLVLVRDGRLVTPDVGSDILEGITRDTILRLGADITDRPVAERRVDRTELFAAEEAFLCGSGQEVTPILSVDRLPVGSGEPGPVTLALQERYFAIVRGEVPEYAAWLTPVWED